MKKLTVLALLFATLLATASCNGNEAVVTTLATTVETTVNNIVTPPPASSVTHIVKLNDDLTTKKQVVAASDPQTENHDGYTAVTAGKAFEGYANVDFSRYNYTGSGSKLVEMVTDEENSTYGKYAKSGKIAYYRVNHSKDEQYRKTNYNTVKNLKCVGAKIVTDSKSGYLMVYYQEIDFNMQCDYASVAGETGAFIRISFHSTIPMLVKANISSIKGDKGDGQIIHENIVSTKQEDGSYIGWAKMSIPWVEAGEYYLNFSDGDVCYDSIPVTITEKADQRNPDFHLQYSGDWDAITAEGYQQSLTDLFYNTFPRLYARWATGSEPRIITMSCDPTYDGAAYAIGRRVVVGTDFANANPHDIGYFSHELTHSAQQFNFAYGDGAWFTENMANYGGFRYFHWSDAKFVQVWQADANISQLYDWGWGAYGDGSKWFFAYLDYRWPTTLDENGEKVLGLLDTLVHEIKSGRLRGYSTDKADDPSNLFNQIVKEVTGYACMNDIRKDYAKEFKSLEWNFVGFADYKDNFLTEGIPHVNDPIYPTVSEKVTGDKTATPLDTPVTEGENLALNAEVPKYSGYVKDAEGPGKMVDGDPDTKWCSSSCKDKTYALDGTSQWAVIDLGEAKTFNTYTIYNTKYSEANQGNMTEWTLSVSNDGVNWTIVDYQKNCNQNLVSFNIGEQNARYILLRGYKVNGNNGGTIRLFEFQLYNQ